MSRSMGVRWATYAASSLLAVTGLVGSVALPTVQAATRQPAKLTLTYWYWGESDEPGSNKWMAETVRQYERLHPNVTVNLVIQSTDTLTSAFQAATAAHSGPDIATLWATMPLLSAVWSGAVAPIDQYVPKNEIGHWLNTGENMYKGHLWGMPIYLIGVPLVYNKALFRKAGLNPNNPPKTWSQFLHVCATLKAHHITPLGMGDQDGYTGAWMFSTLGMQTQTSTTQFERTLLNLNALPKAITPFYTKLDQLVKDGYFNNGVESLNLNQGWTLFPQGKVAMSWTTDGNLANWMKLVGANRVGIMHTPVYGAGELAQAYDATQSSTAFITSWSKHKSAAAQFLMFLHSPQVMLNYFKISGAFPADNRFNAAAIANPVLHQAWYWDTHGRQVWLENFLPPEIDGSADIPGGQAIFTGSGVSNAVGLWVRQDRLWQLEHRSEVADYRALAGLK